MFDFKALTGLDRRDEVLLFVAAIMVPLVTIGNMAHF